METTEMSSCRPMKLWHICTGKYCSEQCQVSSSITIAHFPFGWECVSLFSSLNTEEMGPLSPFIISSELAYAVFCHAKAFYYVGRSTNDR